MEWIWVLAVFAPFLIPVAVAAIRRLRGYDTGVPTTEESVEAHGQIMAWKDNDDRTRGVGL